MTQAELAAFVASHLKRKNIDVVLSGGACVSIYSQGKYVSMDVDLINTRFAKRRLIRDAMKEIGFEEENRYFVHPDTPYPIEFPPGPLAVGEEPVKEITELNLSTGTVRILSATDCVKDRLSWYYHSDDRQCLQQAVWVTQTGNVDLHEIRRWSKVEGKLDRYEDFVQRLKDPS